MANLRQINVASALYVGDFGSFPMYFAGFSRGTNFWADLLAPYILNSWLDPIYRCPAFPTTNAPGFFNENAIKVPFGSYDMNLLGTSSAGAPLGIGGKVTSPGDPWSPVNESEVLSPVSMIGYGDAFIPQGYVLGLSHLNFQFYHRNGSGPFRARSAALESKRHSGMFNISFCDGHVATLRTNALFGLRDEVVRLWNRDSEPHLLDWK